MGRTLRFAQPVDASVLLAIYAPHCTETIVSFETEPPAMEEMEHRIRAQSDRLPWLVAEQDGEVAGYAYAVPHRERAAYRWAVDVSVYVQRNFARTGVGRSLYRALLRILVQLGYYKAFAGIALPNPASVGLHRDQGFAEVGIYRGVGYKFGKWIDTLWMQKSLQPEKAEPAKPLRLCEVRDSPRMLESLAFE